MDKQLDELITEFTRKLNQLVGAAQNVTVSVTLSNVNRLYWNVAIQRAGEDQDGYTRNKQFSPKEGGAFQ